MKLLFDQILSPKLATKLADLFPDSTHVHLVGLGEAPDPVIWEFAEEQLFTIVSRDSDFGDYSAAFGFPPHVIPIQVGNCPTSTVEALLRLNVETIREMISSNTTGLLALY
jgi:predicted nuclease of predicted toxin-antitoxin system